MQVPTITPRNYLLLYNRAIHSKTRFRIKELKKKGRLPYIIA